MRKQIEIALLWTLKYYTSNNIIVTVENAFIHKKKGEMLKRTKHDNNSKR